jgi:hypothetical protein
MGRSAWNDLQRNRSTNQEWMVAGRGRHYSSEEIPMNKWKTGNVARQGDLLIRAIKSLPTQKAQLRLTGILAYGEVTGHAHRVEDLTRAEILECGKSLFLRVGTEGVRIIHDEHAPVSLPAGNYEVEIQREYTPAEIRNVAD